MFPDLSRRSLLVVIVCLSLVLHLSEGLKSQRPSPNLKELYPGVDNILPLVFLILYVKD